MREPEEVTEKGWYWVLTFVQKRLGVRYFSGQHWKYHPGEITPIRKPYRVIERIAEPKVAQDA